MDGSVEISFLLINAGAISAIGGAWMTVRKVTRDLKKERELEVASILQEAKEADSKMKSNWEASRSVFLGQIDAKLLALETRLDTLEQSVAKDFAHVRETYNGEIRNLGDKIEDLRTELRSQHGQLVTLLGKMIDNSRN